MSEWVTLITCTGARPEAFKLCQKYLGRQTFRGNVQWIIVDDIDVKKAIKRPTKTSLGEWSEEYYPGPRKWEPTLNTQRFNLEEAVKHIKGDYVLIIEDDDWYHPTYIESMITLLQSFDIVGEGNAKYYNLRLPGHKQMNNYKHASLCQTGFRKGMLPLFTRAVNSGELYIDITLWSLAIENRLKTCIFSNKHSSIGIKGMPGRTGIGVGHTAHDYQFDAGLAKLREWIGEDVEFYKPFIGKKPVDNVIKKDKNEKK